MIVHCGVNKPAVYVHSAKHFSSWAAHVKICDLFPPNCTSVSNYWLASLENLTSEAEIRGWMTLEQIPEGYGIPKGVLYRMLDLSNEIPLTTALKELEALAPGFSLNAVREAVDAYLRDEIPDIEHAPLGE